MPAAPTALAHLRHELHTPLNHVIGFAEMLLEEVEESGTAALAPALQSVHGEAQRLLGRLDATLAAATEQSEATAKLAAEIGPSLGTLAQSIGALERASAAAGGARAGDVARIAAAARRLEGLVFPRDDAAVPAKGGTAPDANGSAGVILVVDDNEGNRELLSRRLARQGFALATAESGQGALDLLAERPIDLVLLDVMMPGMDGYEALKRIKADPALRHIPVLMISALDEIDSVIRCIELGAEDYLPKPFNPVLLRARIGACLEKKRLRDQEVRHLGELAEWNRTLEARVAEQVAQVERLSRLKRFLSPQLAELMVSGGGDDPLKTHRREIVVVFLDMRGFTAFAETAAPEEVMSILNEYQAAMGHLVLAHEGTLERFTGDGMMIFFNDPVPVEDPAERAVLMALEMTERVDQMSGGCEGRWDYAAIGTVTNLAARLCAEAKPGQILTTGRVMAEVEHLVEAEALGELGLKGLARPVPAFNIVRRK
jgi:adenylate cyclase